MSGSWRTFAPSGDPIHPPVDCLRKAQELLEGRVGRKLTRTNEGDGGIWSFSVDGQKYWVLEDSVRGFPPGSGLEHKSLVCHCNYQHPAGQECPW
jgi:hypothetical protein